MGGTGLGDLIVGLGLDGMDEIRELGSILDEERRNRVANDICPTSALIF